MTSSPALSNDLGHLVDLSLRTAKCAEPLFRELTCALVLAVAEEFDDAAFVGCVSTKYQVSGCARARAWRIVVVFVM